MAQYSDRFVLLGKFIHDGNLFDKQFYINKVTFGNAFNLPLFMSFYLDDKSIHMSTEQTKETETGLTWEDTITFPYKVIDVIRKTPIGQLADGYYTWKYIPLAILTADQRTLYVKLENGDLYEVITSRVPYNIDNPEEYDVVSKNKQMVGKKISENCSVMTEAVYNGNGSLYFEELEDTGTTVKTGGGLSPVIKPFIIDDNWIGISSFPNPAYAVFLAYKKSDFEEANNDISLYIISIKLFFNILYCTSNKKFITINFNFNIIFCKSWTSNINKQFIIFCVSNIC